jgi:hypothetical protein
MWWLLAGFLGLGLVDVGFRGVDALFQAQKLALPDVAPARTTLFVVRIGCWAVILTGLIKVFADVRDRIDMQPRDDSAGNQPPWKKD